MKKAIIIMAKVPAAGAVKTRMQPYLTESGSEELSTAFLLDAELKSSIIDCRSIIAFSPKDEEEKLKQILQNQHFLISQDGKDLGERMFNAFEFAFNGGAEAVVMFGTDSPTFPAEYIQRAFQFLESDSDVVLGETDDGGFYLIGFRGFVREIFDNVEWSTKDTYEHTVSNIMSRKLKLNLLPRWYDVDLPADLERLRFDLGLDAKSASNTKRWLKQNARF